MEAWRRVFREGISPQLPLPALEALRSGLLKNDPRLRPGSTVETGWTAGGTPGILQACAIGYGAWKGICLESAADVESFFTQVCERANRLLGDAGACNHFITWFDSHRRDFVFPLLLTEVNRAIAGRTDALSVQTQEPPPGVASEAGAGASLTAGQRLAVMPVEVPRSMQSEEST